MAIAGNALPAALIKSRTDQRRSIVDQFFRGLCGLATLVAIVPLIAVIGWMWIGPSHRTGQPSSEAVLT